MKLRKQLKKMARSNNYIFAVERKGIYINNIKQFHKIKGKLLKEVIKYYPIIYLKENLIIIPK